MTTANRTPVVAQFWANYAQINERLEAEGGPLKSLNYSDEPNRILIDPRLYLDHCVIYGLKRHRRQALRTAIAHSTNPVFLGSVPMLNRSGLQRTGWLFEINPILED